MCTGKAAVAKGLCVARECCPRGKNADLRCWHDPIMWSNGAYLAISMQALAHEVTEVAIVCCAVSIASTLYHHKRESCFLLLDASFAGMIFLLAVLCLFDALNVHGPLHWMVLGCAAGFPALIFLFVKSDLPGTPHYDFYHTIWHFATAAGAGVTVLYLGLANKNSFDLFCLEYFVAGVSFALTCLWYMRDVVERTFFKHVRELVDSNKGLEAVVTEQNDIIFHGCKVSKSWFWAGLVVQTAGVFAMYATTQGDLTFLTVGLSACSFLYHYWHVECELALDLVLCMVSVIAVSAAVMFQLGYVYTAEWMVLLGSMQLPVVFSWVTLKLSLSQPEEKKCNHLPIGCACFETGTFFSIFLDPVARNKFWHHRMSHTFITLCNLSAATICVATAVLA